MGPLDVTGRLEAVRGPYRDCAAVRAWFAHEARQKWGAHGQADGDLPTGCRKRQLFRDGT